MFVYSTVIDRFRLLGLSRYVRIYHNDIPAWLIGGVVKVYLYLSQ